MQLIARTSDLLELAPGDFRTISFLGFVSGTGNSDGRPSGFNNLGQLAFLASFTDGSSGIFVSNLVAVPEPSALRSPRLDSPCATRDADNARTSTFKIRYAQLSTGGDSACFLHSA